MPASLLLSLTGPIQARCKMQHQSGACAREAGSDAAVQPGVSDKGYASAAAPQHVCAINATLSSFRLPELAGHSFVFGMIFKLQAQKLAVLACN